MRIAFGTQSYKHRSLPLSAQSMVNSYLETAPPQAKTLAAVIASYGIKPISAIGTGYFRGGIVLNGIPYVVAGTELFKLNAKGKATKLGDIPGGGYVDMAGDEQNIMLVADKNGYYWNGVTVQKILDEDFPGAEWVEALDGYYIIGVPSSGQFAVSSNRNPSSWDGLAFGSAEKYPDDLVAGIVVNGEAYFFGRESYEIWYDSGDVDLVLSRTASGFGDIGCLSRFGVCKADNSPFFLGHDGVIYRISGYQPQRISHDGIEQAIENMADKTCFAFSWNEGGHKFVAFSFDTTTFVFDLETNLWHERRSYQYDRWRPLFILRAFDVWLVGDYYTNQLGMLDADTAQEYGETQVASCTSPALSEDNRMLTHSRLELVFEQGVGNTSGPGMDPQIMLKWSDDGGRTWSSEHWRSLGKQGEFQRRALWWRMGRARDRVYSYTISDPVRRTLILATADVT